MPLLGMTGAHPISYFESTNGKGPRLTNLLKLPFAFSIRTPSLTLEGLIIFFL